MLFEVTFLETRGSAVMRRSRRIEVQRLRTGLRFGRGTENEVQLQDIRVDLAAAALFPRSGRFSIQATGPSSLRVNGRATRSAIVTTGDEILIGPYRIRLADPSPDCDATLLIELVQPLGDALGRLMSQAMPKGGGFGRRAASWAGVVIIALLCLVAPIVVHFSSSLPSVGATPKVPAGLTPISLLWEPGELANSHRFFAANCTTCHQGAFARVPDDACLGCHGGIGGHAKTVSAATGVALAVGTMRCTECHQEHRGRRGIVISESRLCLNCHAAGAGGAPASGSRDIKGFPGHPQFRVTLVRDPAGPTFARFPLDSVPPPTDRPGIKFSHKAHLDTIGAKSLGDRQVKGCADCHATEPGGEGFLPVTYKQNCERCHSLNFERQDLPWPNGKLPHGEDAGITAAVWNFYAAKTLQGGIAEPPGPATIRRVPGAPNEVAAEPPKDAAAWATDKTRTALRTLIFDEKRGCAYCHLGTGPEGGFDLSRILRTDASSPDQTPGRIVAPVVMRNRFLPQARFDHEKHAAMACEQCHPARRAETSNTVMIPGIENCLGCHGSESSPSRAESTCVTCHRFHHRELGPMRAADAAAK